VLGPNGSGKSTLLQVVSGSLSSSEGKRTYLYEGRETAEEEVFPMLSMAAPYLELIEEFTLSEHIQFHFRFKKYIKGYDYSSLISLLDLKHSEHKMIRNFSSGMKQR